MIVRSARFQRLQPPYLPRAAGGAAGSPFKPVLRIAVHVAGEKVPAGHTCFRVGRRQGRDIAAGAAVRILPGQARVPAAARQRFRGGGARIGEIKLGLWRGLYRCLWRAFGRYARGRIGRRLYRSGHLRPRQAKRAGTNSRKAPRATEWRPSVSLPLAAPATATGIGAAPPFQYHYINAGGTTPDRPPRAGTPNDVRRGAYKTPDWVNGR